MQLVSGDLVLLAVAELFVPVFDDMERRQLSVPPPTSATSDRKGVAIKKRTARISHHLTVEADDRPAITLLPLLAVLTIGSFRSARSCGQS